MPSALPIDSHLGRIRDAVAGAGAAVVVAEPGAGKTTRVPPALLDQGPAIVLQPRRIAARAIARRIAEERGLTLGEDVGWQVRFERRFTARTRLLVATEGILVARLVEDPLLERFATVILDEFHERSVHADLALALVREAARARGGALRVVVLSATLDPGPVATYLGGCPVIEVPGRAHPVAVEHRPELALPAAVREAVARTPGHVLVFLPGAGEIARLRTELAGLANDGIEVLPLHGSLSADEQDRALAPAAHRKVILATNLAETSLTVDGVTAVVDTGLHRVPRYDPGVGLDRLETERIARDSAVQRAGRAGRTAPGVALRLWDERDDLTSAREPEIRRIDLVSTVLEVAAWGGDPWRFPWFEPPSESRLGSAVELLERLGALERGLLTPRGATLRRLPVAPRLARILEADGGSPRACAACAWLSEARLPAGTGETTSSDLLALADRIGEAPAAVRRAAEALGRVCRAVLPTGPASAGESSFLRAVARGFPDRIAQRRAPGDPRLILMSGHGAVLDPSCGVRGGEFVAAVEASASRRGPGAEARVRIASLVERAWLTPDRTEIDTTFDGTTVRATARERLGALVLGERSVAPEADVAERLLAEALAAAALSERDQHTLARLAFAGIPADLEAMRRDACRGRTTLPAFDVAGALDAATRSRLDRDAPERVVVPSGRSARLAYRPDGTVALAVKLQELFGLADTPRIGGQRVPVTLELLAPNGRPVQTTRDLRGFWERTYPEVRKELRGRYPKHPWPDDPWTAKPTARAKPRGGREIV